MNDTPSEPVTLPSASFQVGDKVRWTDPYSGKVDDRFGIVTDVAPPDAMVTYSCLNQVASVCCELRNLSLFARAVYLDAEDVAELERIRDALADECDDDNPYTEAPSVIGRAYDSIATLIARSKGSA